MTTSAAICDATAFDAVDDAAIFAIVADAAIDVATLCN